MKRRRLFTPLVTLLAYGFLYAPLLVLTIYAFNSADTLVIWEGFSLRWFGEALTDKRLMGALQVSAIVALGTATLSTLIGSMAALAVLKRDFPGKTLFSALLVTPIVLPEIVLAVGILVGSVKVGIGLGYGTLIAGHVIVTVTFSFLIVRAAGGSLDPRLDEAAADLGATGFQAFRRITLPLLAPAILSALMLSAIVSFNNLIISTFATGPGTTPLPIEIYSTLKTGLTPKINALGVTLIAVNVVLIAAVAANYLKTLRKT